MVKYDRLTLPNVRDMDILRRYYEGELLRIEERDNYIMEESIWLAVKVVLWAATCFAIWYTWNHIG